MVHHSLRRERKAFLRRTIFMTRLSIRQQLFLFAVIAILLLSFIFAWLGLKVVYQATDVALQQRLELSRSFAIYFDHEVEEVTRNLEMTIQRESPDPGDMESVGRALDHLYPHLEDIVLQVLWLDENGIVLLGRGEDIMLPGGDMSQWGSVQRALGGQGAQVSRLHRSGKEQTPVIGIMVPLTTDSKVAGALAVLIDLAQPGPFTQLQSLTAGGSSSTELVDDQANVLASSRGEGLFQSADHSEILASLVQQKSAAVRFCHSCHTAAEQPWKRDEVLAVSPLSSAPWGVTIRQPREEVFAAADQLRQNLLFGGLGGTVVVLGFLSLGILLFTRRLRRLARYSERLAEGDLSSPIPLLGYDEVGAAAQRMEEMRQKLQASSAELERRARERAADLSTLYEIDQMSIAAISREQLLQQALGLIMKATVADGGGVSLVGDEDSLVLQASRGLSGDFVEKMHRIRIGDGLTGRAAEQRKVLQVGLADYPDQNLSPYFAAEGAKVIAAAPMLIESRLTGVIGLVRRQERLFTEEELRLLQSVANQVALSVERARLMQDLKLRAERRAALNRITRAISTSLNMEEIFATLHTELTGIVPFERISVSLLNKAEDSAILSLVAGTGDDIAPSGISLPLQHSLSGAVIQSGKPLIRRDIAREKEFPHEEAVLAAGIHSAIIVPLRAKGRVLGTLNLSSGKVNQYSEADLELVQPIADQLALSLGHARFYEEARSSAGINALLHRNSIALSTLLDEPKILQELVQKTLRETGADYASVLLPDEKREVFQIAAAATTDERFRQAIARGQAEAPLKVGEGILGQVFVSGEPLLVEEYARLPEAPPRFVQAGIRSVACVPLRAGEQVLGVLDAASQQAHRFTSEHLVLLHTIAGHAASAILNARLYEQEKRMRQELHSLATALQGREQELIGAYQTATGSLVQFLEARDPYTRGHSDRVRHYCRQIARHRGLTPQELTDLDQAAQLHDLGKIGIPDQILHKSTTLSPAEWMELRLHPEKTESLLRPFPFLKKALPLIRSHHERWDGKGYPDNLAGEEIPPGARIIAVADAYDAMITERPYRKALTHEEAVEELKRGAGSQWDPEVVETFLQVLSAEQPPEYSR